MKERNLLLIALDWLRRSKDPPMSLGHASILAKLTRSHISVNAKSWSVNDPDFKTTPVTDFILSNASQHTDVALGAFIWNEPYTQEILNTLKKNKFPGRIILGGPQVSYVSKGIEQYYPQADIFIRGYAEEPLAKLMQAPNLTPTIRGVHYANQPDLGLSASVDLEKLPSPFLDGTLEPQIFIRFETQRGCPFQCAFCQHREAHPSNVRQAFSMSRVAQEIKWIANNPIIQDIAVLDPTFNSGPNYLEILRHFINNGYTGKLSLQCRIEMVTSEFLDLIEEFNKQGHAVLEFGLQTIHRHEQLLIDRPNNMKRVAEILREVQRRNIKSEISLIFGLPGQTVSSFQQSVQFCKTLGIETILAYPLMLLRGTPLYERKQELALVESSDIEEIVGINRITNGIPHVISSPSFSKEDWLKMAHIAAELDTYNKQPKMTSTLRHTFWAINEKASEEEPKDQAQALSCRK